MNDASPAAKQRCYRFLREHHAEMVARREALEAREREQAVETAQGGEERDAGAKQDKP